MNNLISTKAEHQGDKPMRISRKLSKLLSALAKGAPSQRSAAAVAGLSESYVSRVMQRAEFRVILRQRAEEILARGQVRASARLLELVDSESAHASLNASELVLRINGIAPAAAGGPLVSVSVSQSPGYVINLSSAGEEGDRETIEGVGAILTSAQTRLVDSEQ